MASSSPCEWRRAGCGSGALSVRLWTSVDFFGRTRCRGRKTRLQSTSSLATSAKKEFGNQRLTVLVNVSFPAPDCDLQTSTGVCKSLIKGASAPFFVPGEATEIRLQPAFLRPELRPKNAGGSGLSLGLDQYLHRRQPTLQRDKLNPKDGLTGRWTGMAKTCGLSPKDAGAWINSAKTPAKPGQHVAKTRLPL